MTLITFTVPGLPIAQPRQRHAVGWHTGGPVAFNYLPRDHPVHAYKQAVQLAARQAYQGKPLSGPIAVTITAVYPGPAPGPRKKAEGRLWRTVRPDNDNLEKATWDSLSGILWIDDAQIARNSTTKFRGATGEEAHTEIEVRTLDVERIG